MFLLSFGCLAERLNCLVSWSPPSSGKVKGTSSVRGLLCLFRWIDLLKCMLLLFFPASCCLCTSICRGVFLRHFAFCITRFPFSTWTSSKVSLPFCFRITYLIPMNQLPFDQGCQKYSNVEPFVPISIST